MIFQNSFIIYVLLICWRWLLCTPQPHHSKISSKKGWKLSHPFKGFWVELIIHINNSSFLFACWWTSSFHSGWAVFTQQYQSALIMQSFPPSFQVADGQVAYEIISLIIGSFALQWLKTQRDSQSVANIHWRQNPSAFPMRSTGRIHPPTTSSKPQQQSLNKYWKFFLSSWPALGISTPTCHQE